MEGMGKPAMVKSVLERRVLKRRVGLEETSSSTPFLFSLLCNQHPFLFNSLYQYPLFQHHPTSTNFG